MRFESFINALDIGQCEDQLQRQAIFDLALFLIMVDGVIEESETHFMQQWLDSIPWSCPTPKEEYYHATALKCQEAINADQVEDFIAHRARQLIDPEMRQQAITLVKGIANADGVLDAREAQAIDILKQELAD